MKRVELDSLFVDGNEFSSSLDRLHVSIFPGEGYVKMIVTDEEMDRLELRFESLEEAFVFTSEYVSKCTENKEVKKIYQELYRDPDLEERKYKLEKIKDNKMVLTEFDIDRAIVDYFGRDKNYSVSARSQLEVYNRVQRIAFYLIEHVEYDGYKKNFETRLTEGDMKKVLNFYLEDIDYDLVDYKYLGGIHRVGYFFDEDTPHFEGIELMVEEKGKKLELKRPNGKNSKEN